MAGEDPRPKCEAWPVPLVTRFEQAPPKAHWWQRRGRPTILLLQPFCYVDLILGPINVSAGFRSDGGSIPPMAWPLVGDPFGVGLPAFVVHDWCYQVRPFPREWCDQLLCRSLRDCGVSLARRRVIYRAVRVGGWWGWKGK